MKNNTYMFYLINRYLLEIGKGIFPPLRWVAEEATRQMNSIRSLEQPQMVSVPMLDQKYFRCIQASANKTQQLDQDHLDRLLLTSRLLYRA